MTAGPIIEAVRSAREHGQRLSIRGHGSKRDWLADTPGAFLETLEHSGIVTYDPAELVVTAKAGTPLRDLSAELALQGQSLAFEPPQFFDSGTVGGMLSAGLSGPARPWCGATRDAVLGVELVNGLGETLTFGGQVMKNVAGYDVARLATGACGALGVVLQASLRVQPVREHVVTLAFELGVAEANATSRRLAREYLPLTGSWWARGRLYLRLAGSEAALLAAREQLGGEQVDAGNLWSEVRDHTHDFFKAGARDVSGDAEQAHPQKLWRVVVPPGAPMPEVPDADLAVEWGGGQRWIWHDRDDAVVAYANTHKGWACARGEAQALEPLQQRYMTAIKTAFDPHGVFASPLDLGSAQALETADAH